MTDFSIPHVYLFAADSASIPLSAEASLFQILEWTSGSNMSAGGSEYRSVCVVKLRVGDNHIMCEAYLF